MKPSHRVLAPLLCVTTLSLTACGGGSSSSASPPPPPKTYAVGGNVSGLGANDNVTLLNNGVDTLVVSANGAFVFPTNQEVGATYAVTVQSNTLDIVCSVSKASGSVGTSDVTSIGVSCAPRAETIVYSFGSDATDGVAPQSDLIMDSAGNLYGNTYTGGTVGAGIVFKITTSGEKTTLHSFAGPPTDGSNPQGRLVMDSAGNLYGTTLGGGANGDSYDGYGTVFKIGTDGTETILHSFAGGPSDGTYPRAGLVMDRSGNLYGTTSEGGAYGDGIVFKIGVDGTETVVHSFAGIPNDGRKPYAGLTLDSAGNLYGTTNAGGLGVDDFGTVYKITPDGAESIVFSFSGIDGGEPSAGLTIDSAGNLYGTTTSAGDASVVSSGVVFKISPAGKQTVLHYFTGGYGTTDGGYPLGSVILDSAGNVYGTTSQGGANGLGTVFAISASGTLSFLHTFTGGPTDGTYPAAGLVIDSAGHLYGTTSVGGTNALGTVFKIN